MGRRPRSYYETRGVPVPWDKPKVGETVDPHAEPPSAEAAVAVAAAAEEELLLTMANIMLEMLGAMRWSLPGTAQHNITTMLRKLNTALARYRGDD